MSNELLDLQWLAFGRVAPQGDRFLRTLRDAHPAAHTGCYIDASESIIQRNDIARRGQHGRAVLVSLHRPTAARAAVADGVEAIEHGVLVLVDTIEHLPSP
jgi:hypothetical protein